MPWLSLVMEYELLGTPASAADESQQDMLGWVVCLRRRSEASGPVAIDSSEDWERAGQLQGQGGGPSVP